MTQPPHPFKPPNNRAVPFCQGRSNNRAFPLLGVLPIGLTVACSLHPFSSRHTKTQPPPNPFQPNPCDSIGLGHGRGLGKGRRGMARSSPPPSLVDSIHTPRRRPVAGRRSTLGPGRRGQGPSRPRNLPNNRAHAQDLRVCISAVYFSGKKPYLGGARFSGPWVCLPPGAARILTGAQFETLRGY